MYYLEIFWHFAIEFIFYYPLAMSVVWIVGSLCFFYRREKKIKDQLPVLTEYPAVSILIPAHNEQLAIKSTIDSVMKANYPDFEVIVIDDGSTDDTLVIAQEQIKKFDNLKVIALEQNMGKAMALKYGTMSSKGNLILTLDADAYLDTNAITYMVAHFINGPRVGAVTGNPRVRNRTSLLAKIQIGEYSSIIGMIKRTQRLIGKVLTVSGVIVAFRKEALYDVGLWDNDMVTDDINITWKLEKRFWDIRYESRALCWILVPETIGGLWRQRLRWSQGGGEVIRRHFNIWQDWRYRRLWPVYIEYITSVFWSYLYVFALLWWLISFVYPLPENNFGIIANWKGSMLTLVCLIQFSVAIFIDKHYEKGLLKYIFWVVWYPIIYWILSSLVTVWATPKALFRKMGGNAVWVSPDRGLVKKL